MEIKLLPSQLEFLRHETDAEYGFVAGVGTGKSFVSALWVIKRALQGENCLVGSQTFSTTYSVQMKQIRDILELLTIPFDENRSEPSITLFNGARIRGTSSASENSATGITGFHNAWFDECFLWDENARLYIEGRLRGLNADGSLIKPKIRYTGTAPLEASGWWYRWLCENEGKYVRASTFEALGKTLSSEYIEQQVKAYGGESSPLCRIQIFGELPSASSVNCIFNCEHEAREIEVSMGIDCAGTGRDEDYFIVSNGIEILDEFHSSTMDTQGKVGKAIELIEKHNVRNVNVDTTGGFGSALVDLLSPSYPFVNGVNFGQRARASEYANARAEMYRNLASHWNFGDRFMEERNATICSVNSGGKLMLVPKETIKARIGKSPDGLDALALALYVGEESKCCVSRVDLDKLINICSFD